MIDCQRTALGRAYLFRHRPFRRWPSTHRVMPTVPRFWIQFAKELGIGALVLFVASGTCPASSTAAVSGVVRDAQGVAQMGARVQVLAAGSVSVATAFTNMAGRYRIANLVPGSYQVRATAVLFLPATRRNLQLATGMLATVNLTLNMLADPAVWIPAQPRRADEPGDDWTWTLRSATARPILRMLDDGEIASVSSHASEGSRRAPIQARASVLGGGGGFGEGGLHTVIVADHVGAGGSDVMVRTDVATRRLSGRGPSTEVDAGYERTTAFAGSSRIVMNFVSHPEMMTGAGAMGMQVMRVASARKMQLGDAVDLEAGATVYAIRTTRTALTTQPFLRVTVHPGQVWAIRYTLATSRGLQGYDDLDSISSDLPMAAMNGARLLTESGRHQEIAVSRRLSGGLLQGAVFHDVIDRSAITGSGALTADEMNTATEAVVDTATDSFRLLGAGYTSSGLRVSMSEPLTPSLWATLEYQLGAALAAHNAGSDGLAQASAELRPENAEALTAAVNGRVLRTGTRVRAAYRWQPQHLLTAVDAYDARSDQGYLSLYVRQAMRWGNRLPPGFEATIDVTNLLAQGYQPFLSADGRTLFLAQSPRTIQGGLSFTF